jgi:hypothetical protein
MRLARCSTFAGVNVRASIRHAYSSRTSFIPHVLLQCGVYPAKHKYYYRQDRPLDIRCASLLTHTFLHVTPALTTQ